MSTTSFWILKDDVPTGPLTAAQLHSRLAAGEIDWQTRACPVGGTAWSALVNTLEFGPESPARPNPTALAEFPVAQLADNSEPITPTTVAEHGFHSPPWNPIAIAWLAVPFTPMWAGVMAAINNRRLGLNAPVWLPLGIGFGYLGADLLTDWFNDSNWLSFALYAGSLVLMWFLVLRKQTAAFVQAQPTWHGQKARWVWPSTAGVPLSLLVALGLFAAMRPYEPRQVCEKFIAAGTAKEAAKYTTGKLLPALDALFRLPQDGQPNHFELTGEEPAPADVGGYLVGCRNTSVEAGRPLHVEGIFHLVQWSGEWKIDELYFTSVNGQAFENWLAVSVNYPELLAAGGAATAPSTKLVSSPYDKTNSKAGSPTSQTSWYELLKRSNMLRWLVVGLCGLAAAIFKSRKPQTTAQV
ncbi:MAG: hypothetical protein ACJ8C4_13890 [Gemmataceae bacterium]